MITFYRIRERPSAGNKKLSSWWGGIKDEEEEANYFDGESSVPRPSAV